MAFMSKTAKLVGGGWYTAGAVASTRLEDAQPIISFFVFVFV
jgi:adenine-specific DNA glycosylase